MSEARGCLDAGLLALAIVLLVLLALLAIGLLVPSHDRHVHDVLLRDGRMEHLP